MFSDQKVPLSDQKLEPTSSMQTLPIFFSNSSETKGVIYLTGSFCEGHVGARGTFEGLLLFRKFDYVSSQTANAAKGSLVRRFGFTRKYFPSLIHPKLTMGGLCRHVIKYKVMYIMTATYC